MAISVLFVEQSDLVRKKVARDMMERGLAVTPLGAANGTFAAESMGFDVAVIAESGLRPHCVESVQQLRRRNPSLPVILLADSTTSLATIDALRSDIFTFLLKPLNSAELVHAIREALRDSSGRGLRAFDGLEEVSGQPERARVVDVPTTSARSASPAVRRRALPDAEETDGVLAGESPAIQDVRRKIQQAASNDRMVLIHGETGVGKGLVARLIHEASARCGRDEFVTINCPAIPEAMMESELFGHQAGAIAGADVAKPGRLEMAPHGTVFLDEIGELPPAMQQRLLHVIEKRQLLRLGGKQPIEIDVRFLSATSTSLPLLIQEGRFRSDLFYRLNEFHIFVPPLRERVEDIPLLVKHFVQHFAQRLGRPSLGIPHEALPAMMHYTWPGNVREMERTMRRYALTENVHEILRLVDQPPAADLAALKGSLLDQNQIQLLLSVLTQTRWNQRKAAKILGISYSALRRRIERYELKDCPLEQVTRTAANASSGSREAIAWPPGTE